MSNETENRQSRAALAAVYEEPTRRLSGFGAKIYAVLIIMGIVPVIASAVLLEQILHFNKDIQAEAVASLNITSDFYKAWALSERRSMQLSSELLEIGMARELTEKQDRIARNLPPVPRLSSFSVFLPRCHAPESLRQLMSRLMLKSAIFYLSVACDGKMIVESGENFALREDLKIKEIVIRIPGHSQYEIKARFGIDRKLSDNYELLGEKRNIHRFLMDMEENRSGSFTSIYRNFYFTMFAFVILLLIVGSLFVLSPLNRRIQNLVKATEKVTRGDLSVRVPEHGNDDISALCRRFNRMLSELENAQKSIAYAQRMEAWQEVARKLAHEIKNPLTPLTLAMEQLDNKFDQYIENPQKYRRLLNNVKEIFDEEAGTLKKLVKDFSEFARLPSPQLTPTVLIDFVRHTLDSNPQFTQNAEIAVSADQVSENAKAALDPELMRRVLVNLIRNAIEACVNDNINPDIDISLSYAEHTDYLILKIADNGPGLTPEQSEKIFQPYFTTKSDGTGLGLAIVRKIVQDHGGDIRLENRGDSRGAQAVIAVPPVNDNNLTPPLTDTSNNSRGS